MEYKFKLLKMHCAACALALEQNINQIEGVEAHINYVTKILKLKINTDNPAQTLTEVKLSIQKFDHMVEIVDFEDEEDIEKREKKERNDKFIRFVSAGLLLFINLFFPGLFSGCAPFG